MCLFIAHSLIDTEVLTVLEIIQEFGELPNIYSASSPCEIEHEMNICTVPQCELCGVYLNAVFGKNRLQ